MIFRFKTRKDLGNIFLFFVCFFLASERIFAQTEEFINPKKDDLNSTVIIEKQNDNLGSIISDSFLKNQSITSIMYSDEEIANINRALDSYRNNETFTFDDDKDKDKNKSIANDNKEKNEDNAKSYIYLNSIIYFGPSNWMVWINGKKILASDNKSTNELYVKSIKNDEVVVVWTMGLSKWKILSGKKSDDQVPLNSSNQAEVVFTIKVGQTYVLRTGKIVEGKIS